jgi:uncharacterized protein YdaU (DUF1376 family)
VSDEDTKPDTWMPLVIGDYKKDTGRLTRDLHGGYLLLIMEYWTTGPLADDDAELAAIVLATPREWKAIRPKLERFFVVGGGVWRHKRIDRELAAATSRKAKSVERAKAAAEARWGTGTKPKPKGPKHPPGNAPSIPHAVLEECPISPTVEVDGLSDQSTLYGRERPEARPDGASGLRVIEGGPDESERGWRLDAQRARSDASLCRLRDPDQASELEEFAAYAEARAVKARRTAA